MKRGRSLAVVAAFVVVCGACGQSVDVGSDGLPDECGKRASVAIDYGRPAIPSAVPTVTFDEAVMTKLHEELPGLDSYLPGTETKHSNGPHLLKVVDDNGGRTVSLSNSKGIQMLSLHAFVLEPSASWVVGGVEVCESMNRRFGDGGESFSGSKTFTTR